MANSWLIVGASSFYGGEFAKYLRKRGETVVPASLRDRSTGYRDADYVVNFAAANIVAESWAAPAHYMNINGVLFTEFLEHLRLRAFKRYVHVSTPEVYGDTSAWVTESRHFAPSTPYAVSRAAGDMMVKAYGAAYGLPYVITRTANIYGPGQQSFRLIPKAFTYVRTGGPFPLEGEGLTERSYIHVRDACEATHLIAIAGRNHSTYHISTRRMHTVREVVELVGKTLGKQPLMVDAPDRLGKDIAYMMDSTKLRNLGWNDTITLEDGLREYMEATRENHSAEIS